MLWPELSYSDGWVRFRPDPLPLAPTARFVRRRWGSLKRLEPVDPWPRMRIVWNDGRTFYEQVFWPLGSEESAEAEVEAVVRAAQQLAPDVVYRGWLAHPPAVWEQVAGLPGDPLGPLEQGAYRTVHPARASEGVVARSIPRYSTGLLRQLFVGAAAAALETHPVAVVVTRDHVYQRRPDGTAWRIPVRLLRAIRRHGSRQVACVFGRGAQLILPTESDCSVLRVLEWRLRRELGVRTRL